MIAIVDYGLGNLRAFANIYKRIGVPFRIATTAADLETAHRIILPGVGAFDGAMTRLNRSGMRDVLERRVRVDGVPVLGICVGMQILARRSEEGSMEGLGWIDAEVKRFDTRRFTGETHLPHMGWNDVVPTGPGGIFLGLERDARFYFLHSYYVVPERAEHVIARTDYHGDYASGVQCGHVIGVQFHPEKSHRWGVQLLRNFAELA